MQDIFKYVVCVYNYFNLLIDVVKFEGMNKVFSNFYIKFNSQGILCYGFLKRMLDEVSRL